jgi:hypothetical protein
MEIELSGLRYEIKMPVEQLRLPLVRSWVQLHSAGFRQAFPPRQVNNLYFDTLSLDTYNDHIAGVTERRKLRFRWYGEDLRAAAGQLEIKNKRARVGWKQVQPVAARLDLGGRDWSGLQQDLYAGLRGEKQMVFLEMLHVSRPLVINTYQREYYISADGRFRLTLDYNLTAYDQWLAARPNLVYKAPLAGEMLIEFKCAVPHSRDLAGVLTEFPLRISPNSKYVSALNSMLER